jgi:hypothetical protein
VALDAATVLSVKEPTVVTADEVVRIETNDAGESTDEDRYTVELAESSPADKPRSIEVEGQSSISLDSDSGTLADGSEGQ